MIQSICVLGLGYVGLPTAAMFATHGKQVLGVDIDQEVLATLRAGKVHLKEPGLESLVKSALASGRLTVEPSPVCAEAYVIAVPTPLGASLEPDMSYVEAAAESLAPYLRPGNLVILESTSPIGTTNRLASILELSGLSVGRDILLAYSPERVLPGRVLAELVQNDRVIGGHSPEAAMACAELYRTFVTGEILTTDSATAEFVKLMENTYRDVNIALANEFCRIADAHRIDAHRAIRLANCHPRVDILKPGPGVGGHCVAVDPWFLAHAAPEDSRLIQAARAVNDSQPGYVARWVLEALADLAEPVIAILGLAYKADVADLRESPAVQVVEALRDQIADLRLHDALADKLPNGDRLDGDLAKLLDGVDAIVILTEHEEYRRLSPASPVLGGMRGRRVIDARDCIDAALWTSAGFEVRTLGVGSRPIASVPA